MPAVNWKYEVETGRLVAERTGLLTCGGSILMRLVNAQAYTREVASALKDRGWGMVYKTVGVNIDMMSVDTIVNRLSGDTACVVDGLGTEHQKPVWILRNADAHRNYVDPDTPDTVRVAMSRAEVNLLKVGADVTELLRLARLFLSEPRMIHGPAVSDLAPHR